MERRVDVWKVHGVTRASALLTPRTLFASSLLALAQSPTSLTLFLFARHAAPQRRILFISSLPPHNRQAPSVSPFVAHQLRRVGPSLDDDRQAERAVKHEEEEKALVASPMSRDRNETCLQEYVPAIAKT